jgi:cardiolipin synthase
MKKTITIRNIEGKKVREREINYIPVRFILSIFLIILETVSVIVVTALCNKYIPYFYLAVFATEVVCVLTIINSNENPDYKIPWLLLVLLVPIAGFMIYFMFYDRRLSRKYIKRLTQIRSRQIQTEDAEVIEKLEAEDRQAGLNARLLCKMADTHIYQNTEAEYFEMGEKLFAAMIEDLKKAEKFIFMEYFIIEEGIFWNSILEILKEKAAQGVEVRVLYDDIGCMCTLPGDYYKTLRSYGIQAVCFGRLKGEATNEFNNRSHRKITVIDGKVAFTGGVNIADEYINEKSLYGVWKDVGIRLCGEAAAQFVSIFLADYEMNRKAPVEEFDRYFHQGISMKNDGYVIPFGDGPGPMYQYRVAKTMILSMLNQSQNYVYIMTPYLIIDSELCRAIENAAMRGIDVRIVTPHIPDKKIVFMMTRSYYKRLMDAGVKIYEFESGFVHAKVYLSDDHVGIVGTINMDYRSLVHHFENGVWIYRHDVLRAVKSDMEHTMGKSIKMRQELIKNTLLKRFIRAVVYVISPLL